TAALPPTTANPLSYLILIRLLLGAGEAIIYPASNRFVARWIPSQERGLANGLIFAGVGAGTAIAPILVTYLMIHYGWRSPFWMSTFLGLAVGIVWYVAARDVPEQHPLVSPDELAFIQKYRTPMRKTDSVSVAPQIPAPSETSVVKLMRIVSNR